MTPDSAISKRAGRVSTFEISYIPISAEFARLPDCIARAGLEISFSFDKSLSSPVKASLDYGQDLQDFANTMKRKS
jgi:hypothetical protein